jgi:hypothetical protein
MTVFSILGPRAHRQAPAYPSPPCSSSRPPPSPCPSSPTSTSSGLPSGRYYLTKHLGAKEGAAERDSMHTIDAKEEGDDVGLRSLPLPLHTHDHRHAAV